MELPHSRERSSIPLNAGGLHTHDECRLMCGCSGTPVPLAGLFYGAVGSTLGTSVGHSTRTLIRGAGYIVNEWVCAREPLSLTEEMKP